MVDFSDLDEDLSQVPLKGESKYSKRETQKCPRCLGRGVRVYGYTNIKTYPCGVCRGTGEVTAQRLNRVAGAKKAQATARANLAERQKELREQFPEEIYWIENTQGFDFADSLRDQYYTYGRLSEKQIAAVTRCILKAKERKAQRQADQKANAPEVAGAGSIMEAFRKAQSNKIKRPKLRYEGIVFSLAPESGRNAGSIYVQVDGEYAGKITDGRFLAVRSADAPEVHGRLAPIFANPLDEAVAYGRKVGQCSCCGRELTNRASIEAGIGPICADNFF